MNVSRRLLAGISGGVLAVSLGLAAAPPAGAVSSPCTGAAGSLAIPAQKVKVLDSTTLYPASCVRVISAVRSGSTVYATTQLKDTAHDNQVAVVLARLTFGPLAAPTYSTWALAQQPSGTEAFIAPVTTGFTAGASRPSGIQFAACRSTSWSGQPTNACAFSAIVPV
jgi:hypothetical protein